MKKLNYAHFLLISYFIFCNTCFSQTPDFDLNLFSHQSYYQISHNKDASGVAINPNTNELQVVFNRLPGGDVTSCSGQVPPVFASVIGPDFTPQCFTPCTGVNLASNPDIEGITLISGNLYALLSESSGKVYFGTLTDSNNFMMTDSLQLQYSNSLGIIVDLSALNTIEDNDTGDGLEGITYDPVTEKIFVVLENQCNIGPCQTYLYSFSYDDSFSYSGSDVTVDLEFNLNLGLGDASGLFHLRNEHILNDNHILILSHKSYKLIEFDLCENRIISELDFSSRASELPQAEGVVCDNNKIYIVSEGSGTNSNYHIFEKPIVSYCLSHTIEDYLLVEGPTTVNDIGGLSGLTFNSTSQTLFAVSDNYRLGVELDLNGNILNNFVFKNHSSTNQGFQDKEGIAHISGNRYAIAEERKGRIVFVDFPTSGFVDYPSDSSYVDLTNYTWDNNGLEGVAYDKINNIVYAIKENAPMTLLSFTLPTSFPATIQADELSIGNNFSIPLTDLAGLHIAPNNNLLLVSEDAKSIIELDPTDGTEVSALLLDDILQPSGVATDDGCNLYIIGELPLGITNSLLYKYVPNCIDELNIADASSASYQAAIQIQSNAEILSGQMVDFYAGNQITLQRGFRATAGSSFLAAITPCSNTSLIEENFSFENNNPPKKNLSNNQYKVYPNPSIDGFTIEFESEEDKEISIQVYTISGISVYKETVNIEPGRQQVLINREDLLPGMYLLKISANNEYYTPKIMTLIR